VKSIWNLVTGEGNALSVVVRSSDADVETPVTSSHTSIDSLTEEVGRIKQELDRLVSEAEQWFSSQNARENASPEDVWTSLSSAADETDFVQRFNAMSENQRAEVADYVLATQNVFKGFAALFTMKYDDSVHLLT
jgi:hypothetical protein